MSKKVAYDFLIYESSQIMHIILPFAENHQNPTANPTEERTPAPSKEPTMVWQTTKLIYFYLFDIFALMISWFLLLVIVQEPTKKPTLAPTVVRFICGFLSREMTSTFWLRAHRISRNSFRSVAYLLSHWWTHCSTHKQAYSSKSKWVNFCSPLHSRLDKIYLWLNNQLLTLLLSVQKPKKKSTFSPSAVRTFRLPWKEAFLQNHANPTCHFFCKPVSNISSHTGSNK